MMELEDRSCQTLEYNVPIRCLTPRLPNTYRRSRQQTIAAYLLTPPDHSDSATSLPVSENAQTKTLFQKFTNNRTQQKCVWAEKRGGSVLRRNQNQVQKCRIPVLIFIRRRPPRLGTKKEYGTRNSYARNFEAAVYKLIRY